MTFTNGTATDSQLKTFTLGDDTTNPTKNHRVVTVTPDFVVARLIVPWLLYEGQSGPRTHRKSPNTHSVIQSYTIQSPELAQAVGTYHIPIYPTCRDWPES